MRQYICYRFLEEFYSILQQWLLSKNRDRLSSGLGIQFAPGVPKSQNLLDSNQDYSMASDGAHVI